MIDVPPEFLSFLKEEEARAEDTVTDERRKYALEFYNGEPFGDEEEGRSQLVTRDVAEVVDYMTVSIARTLISGDRVVEFEGRSVQQADYADDATEVIQQQFMRRQDGYRLIHDWIKAGLLEITGVVKTYVEKQDPKRHSLKGVSGLTLASLEQRGMKVAQADHLGADPQTGEDMFDATLHEEQPPKFYDAAIPNEEFRCSPDARDLDTAVYLAHVPPTTVSDLVKMGFDKDDTDTLEHGTNLEGVIAFARDGLRDTTTHRTGANTRLLYREEHVLYDLDEDGIVERLMVHRVGSHVLRIDQEDDHPFEEWCPFPMQHRRIGQSLAEKVMDIQRTRSVLLRQAMDNLYLSNNPRTAINEDSMGDSTIDDLLTVRSGAIVRWKGSIKPEAFAVPFVAGETFQALEMFNGERESRTGITRLNQGLDADALNKTATGTALMQAQGQQMEEYLARNFAEAMGRLFAKKLKLNHQYGTAVQLSVDGEFKEVDPRQWDPKMDLTIRVGLGSGRKEQRLQYRQQLLSIQQDALMAQSPIVTQDNLYNNVVGMIRDANLGNPKDYVTDPSTVQPAQPAPDPKVAMVQGKLQIDKQKVDGHLALKAQELQGKQQLGAAQVQGDQAKMEADAQNQRMKDLTLLELQQRKAALEAEMNERRMGMDYVLQQQKIASAHELGQQKIDAHVNIAANRAGGSLDE